MTVTPVQVLDALGLLTRSALTIDQIVKLLNAPALTAEQVAAEMNNTDAVIEQQRTDN